MGLFDKFKSGLQKTHSKLSHEIKRIVNDAHEKARQILSTNREMVGETTSIRLRDVVVSDTVPAGAFER